MPLVAPADRTHLRFQGVPTRRLAYIARSHGGSMAAVPANAGQTTAADGLPVRVLSGAGLDPAVYREPPLARRVTACLRALRLDSVLAAQARLRTDPAASNVALNAVLIGVSSFFRDPDVFRTLESHLPALCPHRRHLRVLSLGCSSGDELYSVAMLLSEAGRLADADLVGADCRPDAIAAAAIGVFPASIRTTLEPRYRRCFVDAAEGTVQVAAALRARTRWVTADVTSGVPDGPWDLVLCRNIVIYLRSQAADSLFRRATAAMAPGGYLVVGSAERPPGALGLAAIARGVYRKTEHA